MATWPLPHTPPRVVRAGAARARRPMVFPTILPCYRLRAMSSLVQQSAPSSDPYERIFVAAAPRWIPRLLAALIGVALAFDIFGFDFGLGKGTFWSYPPGDTESQLTGYR